MRKFASRHKGFTLVELLIVIVVIGILSAMMMLSSSEAVSTAKATKIIADMRNLKTAALAYFADNVDTYMTYTPPSGEQEFTIDVDKVLVYLNGKDIPNKDSYKLIAGYNAGTWFVECNVGDGNKAVVNGYRGKCCKEKTCGTC
ncbi:MAG: type II secretion system protein [Synergistaceae bacterium]|nr:type II secretion system protein [Synergistaceae bacterium]